MKTSPHKCEGLFAEYATKPTEYFKSIDLFLRYAKIAIERRRFDAMRDHY